MSFSYNPEVYDFLTSECGLTVSSYGTGWIPDNLSFISEITYTDKTYLVSVTDGSFECFEQTTDISDEESAEYPSMTKWIPAGDLSDTVIWKSTSSYTAVNGSEVYSYDSLGRLTQETDTQTNTCCSFQYDSSVFERITKITDGIGNEFRFAYTDGRLSSVSCFSSDGTAITAGDGTNAHPLSVSFEYTGGCLSRFVFPDGKYSQFTYGSDGITVFETFDSHRLEIQYTDSLISRVTASAYCEQTGSYETGSYLDIAVNGSTHTFTDSFGNTEAKTFDSDGSILTITDGDGNYLYGAPDDDTETDTATDTDGTPATDTDGETESYIYSCTCSECTDPYCTCTCEDEENCTCISCRRGTTETKDSFGNTVSKNSYDGARTLSELSSYTSDGGYLASSTDSSGNTVYYAYSQAGFLTSVSAGSSTASMTYDSVGNLTSYSQNVSGNTVSNIYTYINDKVESITRNGFTYNFEYDLWNNRTTVSVAGTLLEQTEYDIGINHDRVTSVTYANGQSVSYTYDSNGNVTGICYDNSSTDRYTYTYDTDGNLTEVNDNLAGTKTVYTVTGTEIRKISDNSLLFSSTADDDGEIQQTADSSSLTYSYDSTYNSVTGITTDTVEYTSQATATDDDGNTVDYSVTADTSVNTDWFGRTVSKTATAGVNAVSGGNGTTETVSSSTAISYNDTATTATTRVNSYSTTVDNITETEYYEYDGMGNISAVYTLDADGVRTNLNRYFYDEAGQLTREDNHTGSFTAVYAYDIGDNVTSVTKYGYTESTDLSELTPTETKTFSYRTSGWKDVLTAVNSDAVTTDSMGNVTSVSNGQSYEWTAGRQLKKLTEADGSYYLYYYNTDGFLSKFDAYDENGVHDASYSYYWDDDKLTAITISEEGNSSCTTQIVYDSEGEAAGFIVNGISAYLYRRNYLGDVTAIYDTEGNEIVHYYYDAFGNPGAATPEFDSSADALGYIVRATFITALNPILYRGYVWVPVAGYSYYLGSRFYIPSLYRFMNADVYEDTGTGVVGTNMFAYCDNNPINNIDPLGKYTVQQISLVISLFAQLFTQKKTVTVISASPEAWKTTSATMGSDFSAAANLKGYTVITPNVQSFKTDWRSIRSKYVIIHTHGDPSGIFDEGKYSNPEIITTNSIKSLSKNYNIACVIITSCSTAGDNGNNDNFAQALSKKIKYNGIVVASKYEVDGADTEFISNNPYVCIHSGWVIYRNGILIKQITDSRITMSSIYRYLKSNSYI